MLLVFYSLQQHEQLKLMKIERRNIPNYDNRSFGANTVSKDITTKKQINIHCKKKSVSPSTILDHNTLLN